MKKKPKAKSEGEPMEPPEQDVTEAEVTASPDGDEAKQLEFYIETIESLRKERDEYYDLLLRKQAEFENFRKRVIKEKESLRSLAEGDVLRELLTVVDAAEKALETLSSRQDGNLSAYSEGYQLLHKNLMSVLERFGVEEVPGVGSVFDPRVHEAVIREENNARKEGEIVEEYRKGYHIKDRLLRPSQVKVSVRPLSTSSG